MQLESLFTDQKWNILKALSSGPSSPLQLSEALSTTMANISQQLRLLEATNLVKKEKIRNRDKGKPRILYSLNGEYAFLIPVSKNFADKKLLQTTPHQRIILRIWFLKEESLQREVEKAYWQVSDSLHMVHSLLLDENSRTLYIVSENKGILKNTSGSKSFSVEIVSQKDAQSLLSKKAGSLISIYTHAASQKGAQ